MYFFIHALMIFQLFSPALAFLFFTSIPLTFLNLISVCTVQYAELGQKSIMPFVGIRVYVRLDATICRIEA